MDSLETLLRQRKALCSSVDTDTEILFVATDGSASQLEISLRHGTKCHSDAGMHFKPQAGSAGQGSRGRRGDEMADGPSIVVFWLITE